MLLVKGEKAPGVSENVLLQNEPNSTTIFYPTDGGSVLAVAIFDNYQDKKFFSLPQDFRSVAAVWNQTMDGKIERWEQEVLDEKHTCLRVFNNATSGSFEEGVLGAVYTYEMQEDGCWKGNELLPDGYGRDRYSYGNIPLLPLADLRIRRRNA